MAVTRTSSVAYGSLTCSGAPYELQGRPIVRYDRTGHVVSCSWRTVISGATQSALNTNVQTFRDELKTRFSNLTVTYAGQATHSFTHSGNTGFNGVGSATRADDGGGLTQVWDALVVLELPADDNTSRRVSSVDLSIDHTGRKVVTVSGTYTAAPSGDDARDNYEALIDAYTSSVISGLGGTYHLMRRSPETSDDQDKVINFSRTFHEIDANDRLKGEGVITLFEDAAKRRTITITGRYVDENGDARDAYESDGDTYCAAVLSDIASGATFDLLSESTPEDDLQGVCNFSRTYLEVIYARAQDDLRNQTVVFTRIHEAPGDAPLQARVHRLQRIRVNYTASLDREQATDPEAKYVSPIRQFIVARAQAVFGVGSTAVMSESPTIDKSGNTISATCELLVSTTNGSPTTGGGGQVVQAIVNQRHEVQNGADIREVWSGDPLEAYVYYRPVVATRVTTAQIRLMGVHDVDNINAGPGSLIWVKGGRNADTAPELPARPREGWIPQTVIRNPSPLNYGIKDLGNDITVTDVGWTVVERYVKKPKRRGGTNQRGSGGSTATGGASTPSGGSPDPQPPTTGGGTPLPAGSRPTGFSDARFRNPNVGGPI